MLFFFFFQAEDGIRDLTVTGVQTCALPISLGTALCLGDPAGLRQSLDRRRRLCAGRAHLVRSRSAHRAERGSGLTLIYLGVGATGVELWTSVRVEKLELPCEVRHFSGAVAKW